MSTQEPLYPSLSSQGATEQAVLGAILLEPDACIVQIVGLRIEDFTHAQHQEIFRAIQDCHATEVKPTLPNVTDRLRVTKRLLAAGDVMYITGLLDTVFGSAQLAFHARRLLIATAHRLVPKLVDAVLMANTQSDDNFVATLRFYHLAVGSLLERVDAEQATREPVRGSPHV